MPRGYVRESFEDVPGNEDNTPILSTKKLFAPWQSFHVRLAPDHLERDDEIRNQDEPLPVVPDGYAPNWEGRGRAYPDMLGWRLKHILGNPVTTAGNGVITDPDTTAIPVGAHRHVWTAPFGPAGASPLTEQADKSYVDQGVFYKAKGLACAELAIDSPEQGGVNVQASGPALHVARIADPVLTPAFEAVSIRPFVRGGLSLPTWLAGSGTKETFGVRISNPVAAVRSLGIDSKFPDIMEKDAEGPIVVSGSISLRQLDPDDWDALLNATGFPAKARWVSDSIIASAYPYKLYVEMSNCQMIEGESEPLANRRRHGAEFQWKSTTPSTGSTIVTLVNSTASYS